MPELEPPSTPKRRQMTRDDRIRAQAHRDAGMTYAAIAIQMHKTVRQIQTACTHPATPQKR
ncbi:MAG: hypothetical protein M1823_001182, partial [Watsoniomyces obsoletus]